MSEFINVEDGIKKIKFSERGEILEVLDKTIIKHLKMRFRYLIKKEEIKAKLNEFLNSYKPWI
ncbi:12774_t:CDS:2 [Entrophospora sp. SA101]|nr:12774_t:CDS:2 [Entrophospora sp. SA101]